jgi:DNA-binding NtrC family response regulator
MMTMCARSILIVDDDKSILRVFTRVLGRKGYCVSTAETGREAKEKLETNRYDAALIDVRLPDMEGTDLLPQMVETSPRMVKIVFTGLPTYENSCQVAMKKADAFLLKPVSPELLLNILDAKLREKNQ